MPTYAVISFQTTHFAMKSQSVLEQQGKKYELIPLPRDFSANCGLCLKIPWQNREEITTLLEQSKVKIDHLYRWERDERKDFNFV